MATILGVIALAATGALVPEMVKRWLQARSQMERLRMQRSGDPHGRPSPSH